MAIKYEYNYTEYKGFPEATEISKSREARVFPLFMLCFLLLIGSVIALLCGAWEAILLIIISIAGFYYMANIYPKVTERKIKKAIKRRMNLREKMKKYNGPYIKD